MSAQESVESKSVGSQPVELQPVLLQMIRDDAVHQELNLTGSQIESIVTFLPTIDSRWFRSRNFPVAKRIAGVEVLTDEFRKELATTLDKNQLKRLSQLERQALGTRMVLRGDIAKELGVDDKQLAKFTKAAQETIKSAGEVGEQVKAGSLDQTKANRKYSKLQSDERKAMISTLTSEQRIKLSELTGKPFDFGQVQRMYPMAPEFETIGVQWVQGGPLKLEDLRGKVVAVHFYAFQCINCVRNLPHYKAWHEDYADQGLVVIGIQTPETRSERNFDRVAAAAKEEGIEYPVIFDEKSQNWKSWSNTMWPTVYLIDKQGFLRRWWQGEMNWKGTPGEQQMRETVEKLLAE